MPEVEALPEVAPAIEASKPTTEPTQLEAGPDGEPKAEAPPKTESELRLEQLERENKRMQRGIDRRTRQLAEERARHLTPIDRNNDNGADDSEPVTLSRSELAKIVKAEAEKLAPDLATRKTEIERRNGVIQSFEKTWGKEKFDEVASDLDDAFGGLTDRAGNTKPAADAIFEADDPVKVIEYLSDPENLDEAERLSRLGPIQAGKAIAKLEAKLAATPAKPKAQASKASAPIESIRSHGATNAVPKPSNTRAWIQHQNEMERAGKL